MTEDAASRSALHSGRYLLAGAVLSVVVILFVVTLFQAELVFLSVFAGVLLACFFESVSRAVAGRTPLSYRAALFTVILVIAAMAAGFVWLAAPTVTREVESLTERVPRAWNDVKAWIRDLPGGEQLWSSGNAAGSSGGALRGAAGQATDLATMIVHFLVYAAAILFIGIYLAYAPRPYLRGALQLVPRERRRGAEELLEELGTTLRWWLVGRTIALAIVGLLTGLGLWILGVEGALALGILAGVLSFIPNIGPILSVIPAALVALSQGGRMVAYVVLLYLGVQFVESYFITPLIQQRAVHLPPALIITAQLLMTILFGVLGLLLATPMTAAAIVVVRRLYIEKVLGERCAPLHGGRAA